MGVEDFNLFGFIPGTESWIGFLPVYPPNWDEGRQKAKWWRQKRRHTDKRLSQRQSGSFGRLHLEKGTKNGAKPGKVAKNGSSTSKLIRKVLWIGAHCTELTSSSGPFGFSSGCALRAHWSGGLAGVWAQLGGKKTFCHGQMFFAAPPPPVFGSGGVN